MKRVTKTVAVATGRHETAEFVLPGHPDKLCDAVADSLVACFHAGDADAQCGVEVACVFDRVFVTGRIATSAKHAGMRFAYVRDGLVRDAYASAGYGADAAGRAWGPLPKDLNIEWAMCFGAFAENERELRHLSDDQAICVGYALRCPGTDYLPPAHWLARRIGRELARLRIEKGAGQIGPDGKVIVHGTRTAQGGAFRPELVSVSLNHHEQSDWLLLRRVVEEAVETACAGMVLPEIEMNGAGMFVAGGPNGDNGLSGKKLVVDAYGPGVPIGGGAWSGKDFFKVDRLGGMAARRLALESLLRERRRRGTRHADVSARWRPSRAGRSAARWDAVEPGRRAGCVRRARKPRAARALRVRVRARRRTCALGAPTARDAVGVAVTGIRIDGVRLDWHDRYSHEKRGRSSQIN